jgi:hypothetical protein
MLAKGAIVGVVIAVLLLIGIVVLIVIYLPSSNDSILTPGQGCENNCFDRGTCDDEICKCDPGFSGENCGVCDTVCYNNGHCNSKGKCTCLPGFSGPNCQQKKPPPGTKLALVVVSRDNNEIAFHDIKTGQLVKKVTTSTTNSGGIVLGENQITYFTPKQVNTSQPTNQYFSYDALNNDPNQFAKIVNLQGWDGQYITKIREKIYGIPAEQGRIVYTDYTNPQNKQEKIPNSQGSNRAWSSITSDNESVLFLHETDDSVFKLELNSPSGTKPIAITTFDDTAKSSSIMGLAYEAGVLYALFSHPSKTFPFITQTSLWKYETAPQISTKIKNLDSLIGNVYSMTIVDGVAYAVTNGIPNVPSTNGVYQIELSSETTNDKLFFAGNFSGITYVYVPE